MMMDFMVLVKVLITSTKCAHPCVSNALAHLGHVPNVHLVDLPNYQHVPVQSVMLVWIVVLAVLCVLPSVLHVSLQ